MMDQKRNSVSGRVATPKNASGGLGAPQGINDMDSALLKAVGSRIRVTTSIPNSSPIEGALFTACPVTNVIAINSSASNASNAPGDFHIIPVSQVANFQILPLSPSDGAVGSQSGFADAFPSISHVNIEALRAREESAIRKMREHDSTRGKGVSREAQDIFDWFRRTLPVRWNGQTIIVNESVLVDPPYGVDNLKAPKDKQQAAAQIRRVLEGYYTRKNTGATPSTSNVNSGSNTPVNAGGARPVVPALPRKGG